MAKTIGDAHTKLAYRLGEASAPTDATELARRLDWFKDAINTVLGGDEFFWFLFDKATDTTVADQQDYDVPTGARKIEQIKVDGYRYDKIDFRDVYEKYELPNSVVPILPAYLARAWYYRYNKVWLIPVPAAAPTTYSISSITQTSGTATVTTASAHGYSRNDVVTIAGADQSGYNGSATILTVPSTTTFTYSVDSATTSPATGTMTVVEQNIEMWYYKNPTEPTSSSSSIVFPDEFIDIIVAYAEGRYWSYAHKRAKAADAFSEFETRVAQLKTENFRRKFS